MNRFQRRSLAALALCSCALVTGCALVTLPSLLKENTRTVKASTEGIAANTREVHESSEITKQLLPAMEGLRGLEQPMTEVAKLGPSLTAVAALDTSMTRVAALSPAMLSLAQLDDPMMRVAQMRPSLDAVAALDRSMREVAALRTELRAVAELQRSMTELGTLREPMMRVAELRQPMSRIAALAPLSNPVGIIVGAVVALGLWGLVTFAAVRLAVGSAFATRPR